MCFTLPSALRAATSPQGEACATRSNLPDKLQFVGRNGTQAVPYEKFDRQLSIANLKCYLHPIGEMYKNERQKCTCQIKISVHIFHITCYNNFHRMHICTLLQLKVYFFSSDLDACVRISCER